MKNGWTKYLVGVLVTLTLFVAMPFMASSIVANDKEARARDKEIEKELITRHEKNRERVEIFCAKQQEINDKLSIGLVEIKADLKYIKQQVEHN